MNYPYGAEINNPILSEDAPQCAECKNCVCEGVGKNNALTPQNFASKGYLNLLHKKHTSDTWGDTGHKYAHDILDFAQDMGVDSILDYGAGQQTLTRKLNDVISTRAYDPAIEGIDTLPSPADLVVSTDVLEHIEPDYLDAVLGHIFALTGKFGYHVISTRKAKHILPDGRNAHLIIQPPEWWLDKFHNYEVLDCHTSTTTVTIKVKK